MKALTDKEKTALLWAAIDKLNASAEEKTDLRWFGDWDLGQVTQANASALVAETLSYLRAEDGR